jgi:hypothetical protein
VDVRNYYRLSALVGLVWLLFVVCCLLSWLLLVLVTHNPFVLYRASTWSTSTMILCWRTALQPASTYHISRYFPILYFRGGEECASIHSYFLSFLVLGGIVLLVRARGILSPSGAWWYNLRALDGLIPCKFVNLQVGTYTSIPFPVEHSFPGG